MNYFKSFYKPGTAYSPNWYGTMNHAPAAEVLLYDDNQGYCIGRMKAELPAEVVPMTEAEALIAVSSAKSIKGVYAGDKLAVRWNEGGING